MPSAKLNELLLWILLILGLALYELFDMWKLACPNAEAGFWTFQKVSEKENCSECIEFVTNLAGIMADEDNLINVVVNLEMTVYLAVSFYFKIVWIKH